MRFNSAKTRDGCMCVRAEAGRCVCGDAPAGFSSLSLSAMYSRSPTTAAAKSSKTLCSRSALRTMVRSGANPRFSQSSQLKSSKVSVVLTPTTQVNCSFWQLQWQGQRSGLCSTDKPFPPYPISDVCSLTGRYIL